MKRFAIEEFSIAELLDNFIAQLLMKSDGWTAIPSNACSSTRSHHRSLD